MPLPASAPELAALDLFVSVVDYGSLSRAAAMHYISQPSASAKIRRLERRLGVKLLTRTASGSDPTAAGRKLAARAREVLAAAETFTRTVEEIASAPGPQLKVIASYTMGDYILPRWLRAIGSEVPSVSLAVHNSTETINRVVAGEAEVGFMCVPDLTEPLEAVPIGRDELVVVVRPDHPWARRLRPLKPEHLAAEPLVLREQSSGTRRQLERLLQPYLPDTPPDPVLVLGSTGAIKAAVLDGVAPAALSRFTVMDELERGRLVAVPVEGINFERTLFAIWQTGADLSDEARRLIEFATSEQAREMITGMHAPVDVPAGV
jgi:DNA-binding transcriptional LysR family regulator